MDGDGTTEHWKDLVQQLKYSERHGLDPADYGPEQFEQLRAASQTKTQRNALSVGAHPGDGREDDLRLPALRGRSARVDAQRPAGAPERGWRASKKEDLAARLSEAIAGNSVRDSLEELAPTHPQYKGLQAALASEQEPDRQSSESR